MLDWNKQGNTHQLDKPYKNSPCPSGPLIAHQNISRLIRFLLPETPGLKPVSGQGALLIRISREIHPAATAAKKNQEKNRHESHISARHDIAQVVRADDDAADADDGGKADKRQPLAREKERQCRHQGENRSGMAGWK